MAPIDQALELFDLPNEMLDHILFYIENIREKIRLMRVSSRFHKLISDHLFRCCYRIVNKDDYLYRSEIERGNLDRERVVDLSKLLSIAPRLTHLTDKMEQIYYDFARPDKGYPLHPIPFKYLRYLHLNHCDRFYLLFVGEKRGLRRTGQFLTDAPLLQTLHIAVDRPIDFILPRTEFLRTFHLDYFLDERHKIFSEALRVAPIPFYGIIDGSAPNLDELKVHVQYLDAYVQLNDILQRLTRNCPRITCLSIYFHNCSWPKRHPKFPIENYGNWYLPSVRIVEIVGIKLCRNYWTMINRSCPNLSYLKVRKGHKCSVLLFQDGHMVVGNARSHEIPQIVTYVKNSHPLLYGGRYLGTDICREFLVNFKESFISEDQSIVHSSGLPR